MRRPSTSTSPSTARSRPARIFRSVLFPAPEGPTTATISPGATENRSCSRAGRVAPGYSLRRMSTRSPLIPRISPPARPLVPAVESPLSGSCAPAGQAALHGPQSHALHQQDRSGERQRVRQDARDVEELEVGAELKADSIAPPQQLHDEHDLPYQGEAR